MKLLHLDLSFAEKNGTPIENEWGEVKGFLFPLLPPLNVKSCSFEDPEAGFVPAGYGFNPAGTTGLWVSVQEVET